MPLGPLPFPAPLASDVIVNAGVYVPRRSLDRCSIPISGLSHVVVLGDSIPQGTVVQPSSGNLNGYFDGLCNRLARALGNTFGGLKGAGFYGIWRSGNTLGYLNSANEWTFAGAVPALVGALGLSALIPFQGACTIAAAAANVATFTPPATVAGRTVNDLATFAGQWTVAAASNGVHTNTFAGAGVLNVNESTATAAATGTIVVLGAAGVWSIITYTGLGANSFTGCTLVDASPDITLTTGQVIDQTRVVSSATAAFNGATDRGQTCYAQTNPNPGAVTPLIPRNSAVIAVADATHAVLSQPATAAGTTGILSLRGRSQIPGGVAAFELVWIDNNVGGTWSWSNDGGASWNDVVSTTPATPTLKRVLINLPINTTLKVRGASAAGVAHSVIFGGIILYSVTNPAAGTGVVVHNICRDGATYNPTTVGGTHFAVLSDPAAGSDFLRLLDNRGDATQQSLQPSLVIALVSNDMDLVELGTITLAQLQTNVATLINRINPSCDLIIVNPPEGNRTATPATQAACRAAVKAQCAAMGVACIDIYDAWAAQSEVGWTSCFADGLMNDIVHPSLLGHADITGHIVRELSTLAV